MERSEPGIGATQRFSRWLDGQRGRPVEWDLSSYRRELDAIDELADDLRLSKVDDRVLRERARDLALRAEQGCPRGDLRRCPKCHEFQQA